MKWDDIGFLRCIEDLSYRLRPQSDDCMDDAADFFTHVAKSLRRRSRLIARAARSEDAEVPPGILNNENFNLDLSSLSQVP
nr:hypothetical protein HmN_001014100 [Hymenolepis microstoma]